MEKTTRNARSKGFTLMEMLIVVAIIAILVAVSIPNLMSSLAKARKAACDENLHVIKHTYIAAALLDEKADYKADLQKAIADSNDTLSPAITTDSTTGVITASCTGLCPSDGTYTIMISSADGAYLSGVCSEHNSVGSAKITPVTGANAAEQLQIAFNNLIQSFIANEAKGFFDISRRFDSNGTRLTQKITEKLKNLGYQVADNTMWTIVTKAGEPEEFCIYIADLTAEEKAAIDKPPYNQTTTGTQIYYKNGAEIKSINNATIHYGTTTQNGSTYSVIINRPTDYK